MSHLGLRTGGFLLAVFSVATWLFALPQPAIAQNEASAQKEKRIALVIGQSGYQHVPKLPNPLNDASAIADKFKAAGFEVDTRRDLTNIELRRAMREFTAATRNADIAVVYFAGHGFEVSGTNYLIPVDAKLQSDLDVEDESLSLDRVVKALEPAKRLRLIILDACRDNPFLKSMTRTIASRQVTSGFAKVEPDTDTLIAFAAKAGSTADDGAGKHSPFTAALLNNLFEPGTDIRIALGRVRDDVKRATGNKQEPFVYGSLGGSTVSLRAGAGSQARGRGAARSAIPMSISGVTTNLPPRSGPKRPGIRSSGPTRPDFRGSRQGGSIARSLLRRRRKQRRLKPGSERRRRRNHEPQTPLPNERKAESRQDRRRSRRTWRVPRRADKARAERHRRARRMTPDVRKKPAGRAAKLQKRSRDAQEASDCRPPSRYQRSRRHAGPADRVTACAGAISEPSTADWSIASQRSLEGFNRFAGMKLDVKSASADALDVVKSKTARICPLTCERGFRADGERCVAIACGRDQVLDDNGACRKKPSQSAARPEPKNAGPARDPNPSGGGQQSVICDITGCRSGKVGRPNADGSLPAGCQRVNTAGNTSAISSTASQQVICN